VGGDPVVCEAQDDCHLAGECNPATGECTNPTADDGTSCDDGDACTQTDSCQAGVCTGTDPVDCPLTDDCQTAAECDSDTGTCVYTTKADGATCDDDDACTTGDSCQDGTCQGDPVVCEAQDECHLAGECDPATGECSNPVASDGTECPDGKCKDGECKGESTGCGCAHGQSSAPLSGLLLGLFGFLLLPRKRRK
jgi:MYXO-CTERM domain-containing protein